LGKTKKKRAAVNTTGKGAMGVPYRTGASRGASLRKKKDKIRRGYEVQDIKGWVKSGGMGTRTGGGKRGWERECLEESRERPSKGGRGTRAE